MRMVIPAIQARDELYKRLDRVFGRLDGFQRPEVHKGFPTNEPPFYVAVDEIIDVATTEGAASMGHAKVSFELNVFLCAVHRDLMTASNTLLSYIDVVFSSVLADHTLGGHIDNSMPRINTAGTAADTSKRYIAAADITIECSVASVCPAWIKEALSDSD